MIKGHYIFHGVLTLPLVFVEKSFKLVTGICIFRRSSVSGTPHVNITY